MWQGTNLWQCCQSLLKLPSTDFPRLKVHYLEHFEVIHVVLQKMKTRKKEPLYFFY